MRSRKSRGGSAAKGRQQRQRLFIALGFAFAVIAGLLTVNRLTRQGAGVTVRLSEAQLQENVEKAFPIEKQDRSGLITTTLSDPEVILTDGSDRIGLAVQVAVNLLGREKALAGSVTADGKVRYVPTDGAFYLDAPRIQSITLEGLSSGLKKQIESLAGPLMEAAVPTVPLYRLDPADTRQALAKTVLRSVEVREGRLIVRIGLAP